MVSRESRESLLDAGKCLGDSTVSQFQKLPGNLQSLCTFESSVFELCLVDAGVQLPADEDNCKLLPTCAASLLASAPQTRDGPHVPHQKIIEARFCLLMGMHRYGHGHGHGQPMHLVKVSEEREATQSSMAVAGPPCVDLEHACTQQPS